MRTDTVEQEPKTASTMRLVDRVVESGFPDVTFVTKNEPTEDDEVESRHENS
jgi:hypothetical protein